MWQHAATKHWYVKDYILVFGSAMRGVSDCRVFRSVHHGPNDHYLLGVSLQLHFKALKRDAPTCRGLWEGRALRDLGRYAAFGQVPGSRFAVLSPQVSEPEEEWQRFEEGVSLAATKTVGVQGSARRNRLGLSSDTLALVATKRAAHLARFSCATLAARVAFRQANQSVKAVVSRNAQTYVKQQTKMAERLQ